jgi:translation initiation factor 2B subunit (eIF-2B alpha/beta/delta family)
MKVAALLIALSVNLTKASIASGGSASDLGANPIRKIVNLLQDMQKEIEVEGVKDKELHEKFMCFCENGEESLTKTIADAASTIETSSGSLEESKAMKAGLEQDLIKHKSDRAAAGADLEKATAIRGKEKAEFDEEVADQKSNYDAISGAIPALEKGMGASSLLQSDTTLGPRLKKAITMSNAISAMEKSDITAFLENKEESGYSPVSGQIVGILKSMKDEMEKTMKDTEVTEESSASGFSELKAAKDKEIEFASEAIESKTKRVGELAVAIVQAADTVEDSSAEKADAEKFLANLGTQCKEKAAAFGERTKTRAEEVSAISEAVSILNDDDALDVFKKSVPSALIQSSEKGYKKVGFLQAHSGSERLAKALEYVSSAAEFHRSQKLEFLEFSIKGKLRAAAKGAVDFGAILKMIDEMVTVLTKEQEDDTEHKSWCSTELASSTDESADVESKISSLTASISESSDEIATLGEDIAALNAKVADLDKDVAVATVARKDEHAEYLETIQLTEAAIQLMGKAKNRLNKFYNPALYKAPPKVELSAEDKIISNLGGASFVQLNRHMQMPEAPATGTYEKKTEKSGGVIALMDMLTGELKSSKAEAEHEEKTATSDYTELMSDSQATRASDVKSITDKSSAKAEMESKLVTLKENKALTEDTLVNVHGYIMELHGSCDFILENFGLRADARANEIESLKNAKAVLSGASYS